MISSDDSDRYDRYDSDVSGPKKFIHHKKKQQPLQTCRFSGPLSHLAMPANDKDAKPSVTHISVSCININIYIFIYTVMYCLKAVISIIIIIFIMYTLYTYSTYSGLISESWCNRYW